MKKGEKALVYMSPERAILSIDYIKQIHSNVGIKLFAIDEVFLCFSRKTIYFLIFFFLLTIY